jgi:sister-chromatid-cohesion protein PDS5
MRYVLDSNPRHAKFAARLLAFSKNREKACTEVIEVIVSRIELDASTEVFSQSIADRLSDANPEHLVAHITVLAQFARLAPDAFESKSDVIMAFLLKEVLMTPNPPDPVRWVCHFSRSI